MLHNLFEPADYSLEELAFAKAHLGESPTVAMHDGLPAGVNPIAIRDLLGKLAELEELRKIKGVPWGFAEGSAHEGLTAIEDSIDRFIRWQERCLKLQEKGGPRHPSQHTWDSTGAMTHGGIGSDSCDKVRTEIRDDGTRVPFAVLLKEDGRKRRIKMPWQKPSKVGTDAITCDDGVYRCSICEKPIASFDPTKDRREQNKARKIVLEHVRTSKTELERHRALVNVPIP